MHTTRNHPESSLRGFTLVELLVVIAIIAVLVALVTVASRGVFSSAAKTRTTGLLATINQAVAQFKADLTYEPPLISRVGQTGNSQDGLLGGVLTPELEGQISGNNADILLSYRRQRFNSQFSLPAFLMGIGGVSGRTFQRNTVGFPPNTAGVSEQAAGYRAAALDDGFPGAGFRSPGPFKAWKKPASTPGTFVHSPELSGRTYGPYIDPEQMKDVLELVEVAPGSDTTPMRARIPGVDGASNIWMYRFIEPSGEAIRYYRQWPTRDATSNPPNQTSTERIPVELRGPESMKAILKIGTPNWQPHPEDSDLMTSSYMLLAPNVERLNKELSPSSTAPYETEMDRLFEESMPFIGATDPKFSPAAVLSGADAAVRTRQLLEYSTRAVRLGPQ